jgi:hypothetical protein
MKTYLNCSRSIVHYEDVDGNRQTAYPNKTFDSPFELVSRALVEVASTVASQDPEIEENEPPAGEFGPEDLEAKAKAAGVKYDRRMSPKKMAKKIEAAMAMDKELDSEI